MRKKSANLVPGVYRSGKYEMRLVCEGCQREYVRDGVYFDTICSECMEMHYVKYKEFNNIICEQCFNKNSNNHNYIHCKVCSKKVNPYSIKAQNYRQFINSTCQDHSDEPHTKFCEKTLTPLCRTQIPFISASTLTYSSIQNIFQNLACSTFKTLCYERKRNLITYTFPDLIKSCQWMNQIITNLTCSKHPTSFSEEIDSKMTTYCNQCKENDLISLHNIENTADFVINIARDYAKVSSPKSLNKFIIQSVNFHKRPRISHLNDLNLLILETRDLINKVEFEVLRCVFCAKKVSFGKMTAIMNHCGHLICFSCYFNSYTGRCPIDDNVVQPLEYFDHDFINFPECHGFHFFSGEQVFKLPCFHYSCLKHLVNNYCCVCGFGFDVFNKYKPERVSTTGSHMLDFLKVMCINHPDTEAELFCMELNDLRCSKCENYSHIYKYVKIPINPKERFNFFNTTLDKLNTKISQLDIEVDLVMVKTYNYLKILSMQKKFNYFKVLDIIQNRGFIISRKEMILFEASQEYKHMLNQNYYLDENTCLSFTLNSMKDMILSGFILNNKILTPTNFGSDFALITTVQFLTEDGKKDSRHIRYAKNDIEPPNNIQPICSRHYFNNSIYLRGDTSTHFFLYLNPGCYYLSKSFSKRRFGDVSITKYKKVKSNVKKDDNFSDEIDSNMRIIDGSLGYMLKGLIISPTSDYLI